MSTPDVSPAHGPVITTGAPVKGQMYYIPDDLFVIVRLVESFAYGPQAVIDHPSRGRIRVGAHALREVHYVG